MSVSGERCWQNRLSREIRDAVIFFGTFVYSKVGAFELGFIRSVKIPQEKAGFCGSFLRSASCSSSLRARKILCEKIYGVWRLTVHIHEAVSEGFQRYRRCRRMTRLPSGEVVHRMQPRVDELLIALGETVHCRRSRRCMHQIFYLPFYCAVCEIALSYPESIDTAKSDKSEVVATTHSEALKRFSTISYSALGVTLKSSGAAYFLLKQLLHFFLIY